jgi:hypothetical protein
MLSALSIRASRIDAFFLRGLRWRTGLMRLAGDILGDGFYGVNNSIMVF